MEGKLRLVFLGTNGWYATRKTGNTVCALIETPKRCIVLDAGDGIYKLDAHLAKDKPVDIFLSHFHLDHIAGLHMLVKIRKQRRVRIFGQPGTKKTLSEFVAHPFTASPAELWVKLSFHELKQGRNILDGYTVEAAPLVHADPCWGYRFEIGPERRKKTIAYCTDTGPCENIVRLAKGADAMVSECAMLPGIPGSKGWPHLTPEAAAKLAKEAGCKKLYLTHFAAHLYTGMKKRKEAEAAARRTFKNTKAAFDGMTVLI